MGCNCIGMISDSIRIDQPRVAGVAAAVITAACLSVSAAATAPAIVVTHCDVSLHSSAQRSYQSTHGEPLHVVLGPKIYQYQARIAVANHGTEPVQFVYVDVRGITRAGATEWAPVGAYFPIVPPHGVAGIAGDPLILSKRMAVLDSDRPTRALHCVVRDPGGTDSRARPVDD
jgi:hypothetical protein